MVISKKMKRLLCLAVVCLMLTPIISFATTDNPDSDANNNDAQTNVDNTDNTAGAENDTEGTDTSADNTSGSTSDTENTTWIDNLNSGASQAATADEAAVLEYREFLKLPESQRKEIAKQNGIVETSKEDIDGHKYICTRGGYELYLKADTLSIIIRDEKTGAVIRSTMTSEEAVAKGYNQTTYDFATNGLLIHYIEYNKDGGTSRYGQYTETAGVYATMDNCKVTTDEIKENGEVVGVTAHLTYDKYGFALDVVLTMEEQGALKVEIPESTVKETNGAYMMAELFIFQMLGHSDRGDREGYLILPDGNGIIVRNEDYFKDGTGKYKGQFIKQAYGSDIGIDTSTTSSSSTSSATGIQGSRSFTTAAEVLNIPYFGTVFEDTGIAVLGIVEKGEYGATIMGNINGVNRSFENYNFAKFVYRSLYNEYTDSVGSTERRTTTADRMIGDITITYLFASEDEATYAGLANKLREELLDEGIIAASKKEDFDLRIDFFGVDKEDFLIFRRNVVATTTDDIKEILGALSDKGVTNILAVYQGWQKDGVYNVPIYKFKADSDVGGNSGIKDLYEELEENGSVDFYLTQDMTTINTSLTSSVFTSVSALTGRTYEVTERFNEVFKTFRFLYPYKTKEYIDDLVEDLLDSGITNVAFSGMSENLFSYQDDKVNYTRQTSMKYYEDALKNAKDKGMNVALQAPFMYLWKYTDAYLDFGIGSSMYVYATDEIPFVSSVLKGTMNLYSEYVNFEANSTEYFLKLVETGVAPSFLITKESPEVFQNTNSNWIYSSEYDKYEEQIIEYYNKLKAVNDKVKGEYIVNHEKLDSDVSITTYSNGVKVYVNFSDVDVTVDGMTIEAESYSVR